MKAGKVLTTITGALKNRELFWVALLVVLSALIQVGENGALAFENLDRLLPEMAKRVVDTLEMVLQQVFQ